MFRGGFDRKAAESVAGGSLLTLKSLLDKSLIRRNFRQGYEMHALARQYGRMRLEEAGETGQMRYAHLGYYLQLMETVAPQLKQEQGPALLDRLEDDHDNLRLAFDWALSSGKLLEGLRLAAAMHRFWYFHNHAAEGHRRLEALLAAVQARVLDTGEQFPPELLGRVSYPAGVYAALLRDFDLSQRRLEDALHYNEIAGNRQGQAHALNSLGTLFYDRQDYPSARRMFEQSLAIDRELGLPATSPLSNLSEVARVQGDYPAAHAYLEESLRIDRETGDISSLAVDVENLATLFRVQGKLVEARRNYLHSLELHQQVGSPEGIACCLEGLAMMAMQSGANKAQAETGARLYGAAEELRKSIDMPLWDSFKNQHQPFLETGRNAVGAQAWERLLEEGRQMGLEKALRMVQEI